MKKTLYITRNELKILFYSPIAWLMMVLFLVLSSVDYLKVTSQFIGFFERRGPFLRYTNDLTDSLISNPIFGYFYHDVIGNLQIFFPLITMGLISREISNGTIKLLYSSPIRIREIVLGKFLAMVSFALILILMLSFTLVALSVSVANPDYGHIASSVTGLFLLLCTYGAIGLFVSSLTSYQIVAAIATFAVFAFLSKVGGLWQDIEALRHITYYMNIQGRSVNLIRGLLNSRDILYFIILIAGFLCFTIIRIQSTTESISKFRKFSRYALVIIIAMILGFITNQRQLNRYADATRDKIYTITPPTRAMLAKLSDAPLEINVYWNLLDFSFWRLSPEKRSSVESSLWEPYIRYKPNIKITYHYYYDMDTTNYRFQQYPGRTKKEIAEMEAGTYNTNLSLFLSPEEVKKLVNVKKEGFRSFFQFKYKDKTSILRTFDDQMFWPSEDEIAASLNRLIATPPKITFLTDELERGPFSEKPRDIKRLASELGFRYSLINQGYDFDTLSLNTHAAIPMDIAALAIADPRIPFSTDNITKIKSYIAAGGNLYIAGELDRNDVVKPVFDELGISLRPGQLIQPNEKFSSDCIFTYISNAATKLSPMFAKFLADEKKYWSDSVFRVAMGGASAIDYKEQNGFHIVPLLYTDAKKSWNRVAPINQDSLKAKTIQRLPNDEQGSFTTAVLMQRELNGKDQRIIVASDADYLTQTMGIPPRNPTRYNSQFGFYCFSYFSYGTFPANTIRPQTDDAMSINLQNLVWQKIMLFYIIPGIIAILGSVILIRRRRK